MLHARGAGYNRSAAGISADCSLYYPLLLRARGRVRGRSWGYSYSVRSVLCLLKS